MTEFKMLCKMVICVCVFVFFKSRITSKLMKVYLNYWSDVLLSSSQECFTQFISPVANTQGAVILGLQMSHPDPVGTDFTEYVNAWKTQSLNVDVQEQRLKNIFVWSSRWFCGLCWLYILSQTCVLSWCLIVNLKKRTIVQICFKHSQ